MHAPHAACRKRTSAEKACLETPELVIDSHRRGQDGPQAGSDSALTIYRSGRKGSQAQLRLVSVTIRFCPSTEWKFALACQRSGFRPGFVWLPRRRLYAVWQQDHASTPTHMVFWAIRTTKPEPSNYIFTALHTNTPPSSNIIPFRLGEFTRVCRLPSRAQRLLTRLTGVIAVMAEGFQPSAQVSHVESIREPNQDDEPFGEELFRCSSIRGRSLERAPRRVSGPRPPPSTSPHLVADARNPLLDRAMNSANDYNNYTQNALVRRSQGSAPPSPTNQVNGVPNVPQNLGLGNGSLMPAGHQADMNHLWSVMQELSEVLAQNRASTQGIFQSIERLQARHALEPSCWESKRC